jgi:uncharacterized repeat protein (TIGR01451 family)
MSNRNRVAVLLALITSLVYVLTIAAQAPNPSPGTSTPAGTTISVHAEGSYLNEIGERIDTISETMTLTVGAVSGLALTPDETAPSSSHTPQERITKVFRVCNTGNMSDSFKLKSADINAPATLVAFYFDLDGDGIVSAGDIPVTVGATVSPAFYADRCLGVLAVADTNDATAGTLLTLHLTAVATGQNGAGTGAEDTGTIISAIGVGPVFSSPQNSQQRPLMLVDGVQRITATPGQVLTYSLSFSNSGDAAARNVVVADQLPANLEFVPDSLVVEVGALAAQAKGVGSSALNANGTTSVPVVNGRFEIRLTEVALRQTVGISFRARLAANAIGGSGTINNALISAENLRAARPTSDATVISDPFGVVYAARSGGASKVNGAKVIVSTDQMGENPISLTAESGIAPNATNANPFVTGSGGDFNFALSPSQEGNEAQPAIYFINVLAPGFHRRLLELTLRPREHDLYSLTVRAIDDQPIAEAGRFTLTRQAVQLEGLAFLVLNIPLFETANFEITKVADKERVDIGDAVSYHVVAHNALASALTGVVVRDSLPASFHYVPGTATVEGGAFAARKFEPEIAGNEMLFHLGQLNPGERVTIAYRVRVGVNAIAGEQFNSAMAEGTTASSEKISSATARARVVVSRGIFGMQRPLIGRVFVDMNANGEFDEGDLPIPSARLYLNNGDSVVTDSQGMYNFPLVNEGSVTISLDPVSITSGYRLVDDGGHAARSWARLLRTPLGGGGLLRQNFALLPPVGNNEKKIVSFGDAATSQPQSFSPSANLRVTPSPGPPVSSSPLPSITQTAPLAAGTYELVAGDNVAPIAPGEARIDSPTPTSVILSAAMRLQATVAEGWTAALEVNGEKVGDSLIGERRVDHKNKVSTYTFIGVNVRPGPNRVRVTPISPEGKAGNPTESFVYGRGPAKRLTIVPEKKELPAGSRERTLVYIRAFDQWNHPAADDQVFIEVSDGVLLSEACGGADSGGRCQAPATVPLEQETIQGGQMSGATLRAEAGIGKRDEQAAAALRQQKLSLSGGEARVYLMAANSPGNAELHAQTGQIEAQASVRYLPEMRRAILVGMAEATFGRAAPDREWQGVNGKISSRFGFFYRGTIFGKNLLTLAYDSHLPFHRTAGRDRVYELDPRDRVYPLFGDSSTRFEEARSNSKVYARLDRGPSFVMFGDFNPDQDATNIPNGTTAPAAGARLLTGYSRNLTGIKLHLDNGRGDSLTLTGARPDTAFARDVFPGGGFGLLQLSQTDILPGSENVVLEIRDRRNPETIISREPLSRSVDYNLDSNTGIIFLLRSISTFDFQLNLLQVVVTYEHSARGLASSVYTGRLTKNVSKLGLRIGATFVNQRQPEFGPFSLGGIDLEKSLPRGGTLRLEYGMSRGRVATGGNLLSTDPANGDHNGQSYHAELTQPLPFYEGTLKASVTQADADYLNPFGATVAPGSRRAVASVELKLRPSSLVKFGLGQERNKTDTVDNQRLTASLGWTEQLGSRFKLIAGYDFRKLEGTNQKEVTSHLLTVGAEWRPSEKLTLAVKREQNLGEADPTYPDQTTLSASYQFDSLTRLFYTQRLAAAPIVPISDVSKIGFASTGTRNEMAFGIERKLGRFSSVNSRYQIENGINGSDSFAVIGLVNKLPINETVSLEFGFERGQHVAGKGPSFNNGSIGVSWLPTKSFRTVARYELRDRNGFGQALTLGAAGKLGDDITTLASFQWTRSNLAGNSSATMSGTAALAFRPLHSDRAALLFSYNRSSLFQKSLALSGTTVNSSNTLSADGLLTLTKRLEFYGRVAAKSSEDGRPDLPRVSTLTYMAQGRLQERLTEHFDVAAEFRWLAQPVTGTRRAASGAELGYWALPDLRIGVGYNFTGTREPAGNVLNGGTKRGFYFTISSKLSNLFNLFGNSHTSLTTTGGGPAPREAKEEKK